MIPKIAAIQMASGPQIKANLMEACRLIREASTQGADMVVLPECFALMAMQDADNIKLAEDYGHGEIQNAISQCAIENNIWIVAGSLPIKPEATESDSKQTNKVFTASLMFDNQGEIIARYNKIHLFDVDLEGEESYRESDTFEAGEDIVVVDTPFGRIGLSICYDLRFPLLYREMAKQGAEIFLIPAAFTHSTGEIHWETLIRARAIENQCYVIAPAQGGYHVNGRHTYGHSMTVDYLGQVHSSHLTGNAVISINIDLDAQKKLRESFPVLQHDKEYLYPSKIKKV